MKDEDSFDLELEEFNNGKLPASYVFNLGKPGEILQNCGFPAEHRIELAAARLRMKATQGNHPFDIMDIQGLARALQKPVAVFEYGDKSKSQNVIVNIEKDGKNFLVGVFFNQIRDGFEVSSIRGLFNRDNMDWIHWIQQGKMIYGNKEKIQVLAEQQRTNLADVHSKEARTSSDSYYLDSVDNILQSFGDVKDIYTKNYPEYAEQKERFEIFKKFRSAYQKVDANNVLDAVQKADEFYDALKSNNKEVIARYTDFLEYSELADAVEAISTVHSVINTNGRGQLDPRFSSDNIFQENEVVNKKIANWSSLARVQFPIEPHQLAENNILTKTELVNKTTSTLVIDSNQAARIKAAREIKENMLNLSENERAAAIAILEAGAKNQGMGFSEYVEKTFPDGIFGDIKKAENAAKQQGIKINGAVSVNGFGENVKAVIYAGKTADFSTWCHELSHIWQAQLTGELKQNAEEAFQVKDSDWQNSIYTFQDGHTDTSAEAFAYGFEDFLKNKAGEMATEDKKEIFEKFADYMSRTYNGVKQHIEINEKIASIYQKFVELDDNILAQAEKAVQMEVSLSDYFDKTNSVFFELDSGDTTDVSNSILEGKPIKEISTKEFNYDGSNLKDFALNYIKNNPIGNAKTKIGNVEISETGLRHSLSHTIYKNKLYAIPAIKETLEKGTYLGVIKDFEGKRQNNYYFAAPITIDNDKNILFIRVKHIAGRDKALYIHDIFTLDEIKKVTPYSGEPNATRRSLRGATLAKSIIQDYEKNNIIQNNPLLFQTAYHGSGANFDKFNTSEYGLSGEGYMAFGYGVYVSNSEAIAKSYAGRQGERNLYTVEVPDGNYIGWDKPVSKSQKENVKNELYKKLIEEDYKGAEKEIFTELTTAFGDELDGKYLYGTVSSYIGSDKETSKFFKDIGFSGIEYPAGESLNAVNYVIFNDEDIKIKEHFQFQKQKEEIIMESTENLESQEYWKEQFQQDNAETFKAIDNYLDKGIRPRNDEFIFEKVPEILKAANVSENEIVIKTSIINKAKNEHSLSDKEIKDSIKNIASPVLIFNSDKTTTENKKESFLCLTDTFAENGKPIAFSMNLDSDYERKNRLLEINEIRSIHDRTLIAKNGTDLIQKWTENGLCRYVDDKKISEWSKAAGVQFPLAVLQSDKNNILSESNIVNGKKISERQLAAGVQFPLAVLHSDKNNILSESDFVNDKKISNLVKEREDSFLLPLAKLDENNINLSPEIVNGTDYQEIKTFSKFAEQQKAMEKEYQEYLGTISPDEESSRRIDSGEIFGKLENQQAKEELNVATYKFQSGETLDEIIQGNSDFPTESALLDNMIDSNIREVYEYATNEEKTVLKQFAAFRNDYDTDMKNLAVQTDCVSRWIAAKHWNPEMQEFQEDYVNHAAVAEFPYKLPWEMKRIEDVALQSESKEKATEFVLSKLKSAGIEIISDKEEFENTLAELKDSDELIQRMTESFEKSEKLHQNNNSVLRANEEVRSILTEALDKTAEPLKEVVYSRENYVKIFEDGVIQSPVETIKMGTNQFIRLCPPDRNNLMGAIYETITKPSIVLEKETFDEKSENFKPVHVYGRVFINQDNDHKRAVESIIVFKDGQNIAASLHNKTISALVKQIKTADDIIYLDKEVSRVATFSLKAGDSHVVKETEEFLSSAGQKSLPLWNKSYDTGKILSISDLLAKGEIEGGKLEITKDNFDKYFNIFNQNIRVYKDKPNKIASDLFSFYVKPEDKPEMKQWLESQGYKINENQRSEKAVLSEYTVSDGTTYGFAYNGKIYLNPDFTDSNVAVHEYTHLWDEYTKKTNPQLWEKGKEVFKETHIWQEVKNDPNYADIADNDDMVLSEVHARICGAMSQEILERIAREDGEIAKDRAIDWDKEVNEHLFSEHGLFTKENIGNEQSFIKEFMSLPVKDLFSESRAIKINGPSQDELGNYLVTVGKVDRRDSISEENNTVVAVGVAPTIQTLRTSASSTALRASATTVDESIAQSKENASSLSKNYTKVAVGVEPTIWRAQDEHPIATMLRSSTTLATEETISQVVQKSINEEKTKMPDQLVYAAAEVGQVIEQRTLEAQSIVNPTRGDRLSTISVPLDKDYNEDFSLSTGKNMSETQKSINEQKTKLQILEQEDKEQLEAIVMTARETIKESLAQNAEPLVEIDFSKANYDSLFPRGIVQTPIETVKLGENQFEKLDAKDRKRFLLATFQTLSTPDLVIDEDREGSHSHNYIKSFVFDEKTKAVQDVVVNINGENISITAHPRDINNVVNKIKMPDQLVYAAAKVGQVIEQRVQNELGIVNPTRADRLSTISVPLNKEYNEDFALSTVKKLLETEKNIKNENETELQQIEPGLQKKFDKLKAVIKSREEQEPQGISPTEEPENKRQAKKSKSDIIRQAGKDFLESVKKGIAPFFNAEDDFQRIIMHPQSIINASNGLPFSGESQLLAQIYHKQHEMEGEIVTSISGAKSAGTIVLDTPESRQKNFALTDTSSLAEKNSITRTRYFMPESCEEPDKVYAHTLQQQRPDKIRSYRDLIRHFENIPNGQKEIADIRIRIAHEHLKEIQSRLAMKEERTLSVEEIEERKNFLRNYFERLPADYRASERSAFEDTFGIQLNPEKTLEINLQRKFKDIDFDELKKNTKKSIELENRKLSDFIEKNTMENKKLASIFSNEYKSIVKEEKLTAKNLKIEALGIKEPETFLGKYLAACNTNAEFITDKETVDEVKKNLVKKLEENFKLEKYDILKEIGRQAQSISNETIKQISFEKAHSNNKSLGKALTPDKEISLIGMGK